MFSWEDLLADIVFSKLCHIFTRFSLGKNCFASLKPLVSGTNSETSGRTVDDPSGFGRGCPGLEPAFSKGVVMWYLGGVFSKEIGADDIAMISLLLYYLCY